MRFRVQMWFDNPPPTRWQNGRIIPSIPSDPSVTLTLDRPLSRICYHKRMQTAKDFLREYKIKTNSHDFSQLQPLIATNATYWFTDGSYSGIEEIKQAIVSTFNKIKNETYSIKNIQWIIDRADVAVCSYDFEWQGLVAGEHKSGKGRGTNVMVSTNGKWQMLHEHLSR